MVYESTHPLVKHKIGMLRNQATSSTKFRQLVTEISTLICYEASADLTTSTTLVQTPVEQTTQDILIDSIGIVPILRAGLGMVDAIWAMIPHAEVWHIGMYRDEETLEPIYYYDKFEEEPTIDIAFVVDPMLATGGTASACVDRLKKWGVKRIKFIALIAAPEGIAMMQRLHPDVDLYIAAVDSHLNAKGYIVPGLGDAGDRLFGTT